MPNRPSAAEWRAPTSDLLAHPIFTKHTHDNQGNRQPHAKNRNAADHRRQVQTSQNSIPNLNPHSKRLPQNGDAEEEVILPYRVAHDLAAFDTWDHHAPKRVVRGLFLRASPATRNP